MCEFFISLMLYNIKSHLAYSSLFNVIFRKLSMMRNEYITNLYIKGRRLCYEEEKNVGKKRKKKFKTESVEKENLMKNDFFRLRLLLLL